MKKTIKRAAINVRIEEDLEDLIGQAAKVKGIKTSTLARELLVNGLAAMGYHKPSAAPGVTL